MTNYFRGILRAMIPRHPRDIVAVSLLTFCMLYVAYRTFFQEPPGVTVFSETQYPKTVPRNGFFYLSFDLAFDKDCSIQARRFIRGNDGVEYLAQEDYKNVAGGERVQYIVRVPVSAGIPLGPALVRSQFIYRCDVWTRYLKPIIRTGQARKIEITPSGTMPTSSDTGCWLPPRNGFIPVRAYYRKKKPSR